MPANQPAASGAAKRRKRRSTPQILIGKEPWSRAAPGIAPLVVAHRAGGGEAPENTIAAAHHAHSVGAGVLQIDVLQTADGIPVVFHDPDLERVTGLAAKVREVAFADLPRIKHLLEPIIFCEASDVLNTSEFLKGNYIPTLDEFLQELHPEVHLVLEVWEESRDLVRQVGALLHKHGMLERVTMGSPDNRTIWQMYKKEIPGVPTFLPFKEVFKIYTAFMLGMLWLWPLPDNCVFNVPLITDVWSSLPEVVGFTGIKLTLMCILIRFFRWLIPSKRLFRYLQDRGIPVMLWILNRESEWEAARQLQVTAVMTDYPSRLVQWLRQRNGGDTAELEKPLTYPSLDSRSRHSSHFSQDELVPDSAASVGALNPVFLDQKKTLTDDDACRIQTKSNLQTIGTYDSGYSHEGAEGPRTSQRQSYHLTSPLQTVGTFDPGYGHEHDEGCAAGTRHLLQRSNSPEGLLSEPAVGLLQRPVSNRRRMSNGHSVLDTNHYVAAHQHMHDVRC